MNQDQLRQVVAQAAVDHILPHLDSKSIVGVGTSPTASSFIDALVRHKTELDGVVASSETITRHLREYGISVYELNTVSELGFCVDGADESNEHLELIKGGGVALTCEKIVAAMAKTFTRIVDTSKLVPTLGQFPPPVEVIPVARSHVTCQLAKSGGDPVYRESVLTDNDSITFDMYNLYTSNLVGLEEEINAIVGVVTSGLFTARLADLLLLGTANSVRTLKV